MAKVKIGKIEAEIPEAVLGDVEDAAAIEERIKKAAEAQDFDGLVAGYLEVVLVMARSANSDLTVEKMRRALPFMPAKRLAAARQAYTDTLLASGVMSPGGEPGEAPRP